MKAFDTALTHMSFSTLVVNGTTISIARGGSPRYVPK